jgi:putative membrane protein
MKPFLVRWLVTTLAVFLTAHVIHGITYDSWGALICASLLLGIVNALVRPILLLLSLPLIVFTMGLFILVVNAFMLKLVSGVVWGFHVTGFWSAFFGSILIGFVSWILNGFFRDDEGRIRVITRQSQMKRVSGRIIDI